MGQRERLEGIRTLVKTEKRVVVSELSRQFEVTEETIRRDLEKLEGERKEERSMERTEGMRR